jgi:hypothetical protein
MLYSLSTKYQEHVKFFGEFFVCNGLNITLLGFLWKSELQ